MSVSAAIRDANNPHVRVPPADEIHSNMFMIQVDASKLAASELLDKFSTVSYCFNTFFDNSRPRRLLSEVSLGMKGEWRIHERLRTRFSELIFFIGIFYPEKISLKSKQDVSSSELHFVNESRSELRFPPSLSFWIIKFEIFRKPLTMKF